MAGSSADNMSDGEQGNEKPTGESGKYVRYTNEQVEALERVYEECPKPSSIRRTQLIKENAILSNIEPKQIKVWFQNRRCRERQRLESSRLHTLNNKVTAVNKVLTEENDALKKKVTQLALENAMLRSQLSKYEDVVKLDVASAAKQLGMLPEHVQEAQRHAVLSQMAQAQQQEQRQQQLFQQHQQQQKMFNLPFSLLPGNQQDAAPALPPLSQVLALSQDHNMSLPPPLQDNSRDAVGTSNGGATADRQHQETSTSGLLIIAEEMLTDFVGKALGTNMEFVEMPGWKENGTLNPPMIGAGNFTGVAARASCTVAMPVQKAAELLKDRVAWLRDCRRCDVLGGFGTAAGGMVELVYTQMYAPTTLAPPRDFCTLRYTTPLDDGGVVICERSLSTAHGGTAMPIVPSFVRAEMLPSGYLVRPMEGSGNDHCAVVALDHADLEPWSVPEVLRPLYKSSVAVAHRMTLGALRYLQRVAKDSATAPGSASLVETTAWRSMSERIARGFNDAVNGFGDDNWSALLSDGHDDVSVAARPSMASSRAADAAAAGPGGKMADGPGPAGGGVLCAKASMLLQNVPPSLLIRFLRDHRSDWADGDIDAGLAAAVHASQAGRASGEASKVQLPYAHAVDEEEFLEMVKLEPASRDSHDRAETPRDTFLLQLCSGLEEEAPPVAQLVFAPVDALSTTDGVPLLPSGFRVIPIVSSPPAVAGPERTLDLTSTLESQSGKPGAPGDLSSSNGAPPTTSRSVLTIAFQFVYDNGAKEAVAVVGRQYVRSVIASIQRVAMALAPNPPRAFPPPSMSKGPGGPAGMGAGGGGVNGGGGGASKRNGLRMEGMLKAAGEGNGNGRQLENPDEAFVLVQRILHSYRVHLSMELVSVSEGGNGNRAQALLTGFWEHPEAIICVMWKPPALPALVFANKAGLDMMEVATNALLSEVPWERTYGEEARKTVLTALSVLSHAGSTVLGPGVRLSAHGRAASYERCIAWKVLMKEEEGGNSSNGGANGVSSDSTLTAFMHQGWNFMT